MNDFFVSAMLLGALSTGGTLPFWAVSNQGGIMPDNNGALAVIQAYKTFDETKTFQWQAGVSLAANWQPNDPLNPESSPFHPMVDELYAGARWNVLRADLGMMHREREFLGADKNLGSLSVNEGHIIESNNSRAMPGYKLVLEPWAIPFTGKHVLISGVWGDYKTIDDRYMKDALVHRLQAYLTYDSRNHFYVRIGLDHYALWGGTGPKGQTMDINFKNYLRICTGRSAGSDGTISDQINCLGDHGGAEELRMGWRYDDFDVTFQYEKPYSDKSGMRFNNLPDGAYTLHFSLKDKDRWVSDVLAEFHYTMWQSGAKHEAETDADGNVIPWHPGFNIFGGDNYFTNGEYKSGWTHFGRAICGPLFYTKLYNDGVYRVYNNRYIAYHLGVSGKLFKFAPYRLMLTYSCNCGTYNAPLVSGATPWGSDWQWWEKNTWDQPLSQFSAAFNGYVPFKLRGHHNIDLVYGLYADAGEVLTNAFACTLGVRYTFK
ncbi:MAG: hypothetical protein IKZ51_04910 [Bacteroidales bacterium]|nr:hypothetical protein [Bacteroidales bacterium]